MRFYQEWSPATRKQDLNASRFALMNLKDYQSGSDVAKLDLRSEDSGYSRLNRVIPEVTRFMERFDLGEAARVIYEFI